VRVDLLGMRFEIFPKSKTRLYRNFILWYAEKGGEPVLRGERSWTKVSGFMIRTRKSRSYSFQFRRVPKY
jgi:hypothetical protein